MLFKISSIAALITSAAAHMALTSPCPRYSANGENCPALPAGQSYDYSIKSPISVAGQTPTQPLCKYTTPYATPSATWSAGQAVTVKFQADGAAHGGGHCQFSLSYDGGKTFVVVHEELKYCFFGGPNNGNSGSVLSYTFNLPTSLPSSNKAVFAWTWVNAIGNREFYMNCADVAIKGTSGSYTGKQMTIANFQGYPTIGEFNGNYATGLEYYTGAKQITVTGNGSTTGGGAVYSSVAPAASSSVAPVAPVVSTTATRKGHNAQSSSVASVAPSATPVAPPAVSSAASSSCTHGAMQCSGTGYKVCVWGKWSARLNCGARTACKQASAATIVCDWA
ncbi:hypothetical protein GGI07_004609 [Coemansia sp. Benny D115]|nr:hypothetical protein GGI07_004609 [Coemansia sp. Benny D115]